MVQESEKYRDEHEANESKYEAENGLRNSALPCGTHRLRAKLNVVRQLEP